MQSNVKTPVYLYSLVFASLYLFVVVSCKKDEKYNLPPIVTITSPISEDEFMVGGNITITVDAHDQDGDFVQVEFSIDDSLLSSVTSKPFSFNWDTKNEKLGSHNVKVTARDKEGELNVDNINIILELDIAKVETGTVTDYDGNIYKTIKIGSQWWMVENLAVSKFNDGEAIPYITNSDDWSSHTFPAYCWYNNEESAYKETYGALYNWYAVQSGKLSPLGWHVPSNYDWNVLISYLGGANVAGDKLKKAGIKYWKSPNIGATNESGFSALPGGYRASDCFNLNSSCFYWSSTEDPYDFAFFVILSNNESGTRFNSSFKTMGASVRCVKQ